jgi:hypothetical protein
MVFDWNAEIRPVLDALKETLSRRFARRIVPQVSSGSSS